MCVGYQAFAFVVGEFDILSAVTMCPMAGKYRLANRLWTSFLLEVLQVVRDNDYGNA